MTRSTWTSLTLTVAVVAAGLLAAWSLMANASTGVSAPQPGSQLSGATPTPALIPGNRDVNGAINSLRGTSPEIFAVIDAWRTGDAAAIVSALPSRSVACDEEITRGVSLCERLGIPSGSQLTLFQMLSESIPGFEVREEDVVNTVRYLTKGRSPQVEMLSRRDDGAYLVVLRVDPAPALQFPGPLKLGGADIQSVYLTIGSDGRLLNAEERIDAAPPLEPLQNSIRRGTHTYTVIAADDAFRGKEKGWKDKDDAQRRQTPTTR